MLITSWNINGIRACIGKGLKDFVNHHSPDILCLQETKAHPDQLDLSFKKLGQYKTSYWSASGIRKGYSGTVTYSKIPVEKVVHGMGIKKFDWEGRFVITEYKKMVLLNIYFPNGALTSQRHLFKQEFLKRLNNFLTYLKQQTKKPLIIVGDYNTAYLDIDVFDPKRLSLVSGFFD